MWQGIPFKLINSHFLDQAIISIQKIPPVIIQSAPDLSGALLSGVATLIGGAIPALIALKAIKANKELMIHQQKIIHKQNFIDNLRMKMSIFTSDAERISIYVEQELTRKGLTLAGAPKEVHSKVLELAYQLDLQYNYMELLLSGNKNFDEALELMKTISEKFLNTTNQLDGVDIHILVEDLVKKTIYGISKEWDGALKL